VLKYSLVFISAGLLAAGIVWLIDQDKPWVAGMAALFPVITITTWLYTALFAGEQRFAGYGLGLLVGLIPLFGLIGSIVLLSRIISPVQALGSGMVVWLAISTIIIYLKQGFFSG